MTELNGNRADFKEKLRLEQGNLIANESISLAHRLDQLDQMFELWEMFRKSRIAAGTPGPYDLPPKNMRPISK